ncbi:hypothetical protein LSH36_1940g00000 [Paralvinella palmiformis]|uniref:YqaJ viral recombinase domain-containing protein n=1 Tax=Paralvinella palmiformis TaxID=53620 RepID=A0AAD9MPR5_9ANNE|nr:hypothetical protein LSH36_1940g00000 [Paralvinella palmiformis]
MEICNESRVQEHYVKHQFTQNLQFKCETVGLLISTSKPFVAASSDGTVVCSCCGKGCLEIKFPYKHKDNSIHTAHGDETFCLDTNLQLKKGHRYYTEIQLQMYVHDVMYYDFVIFTNIDMVIMCVSRDDNCCALLLSKCQAFFFNNLLPEMVTHRIENTRPSSCITNNAECLVFMPIRRIRTDDHV